MQSTLQHTSTQFNSFVESFSHLDLSEKRQLWKTIYGTLEEIEDELFEQDSIIQNEVREAREEYKAGKYVTLDEFISKRKNNNG
ncbi:MAG: hypothetical protein FJ218_09110 [Ignavibacteria bacterium]|nr:hypothetical protein [Ignavibacteria bacterium]